MDIKTHHVIYQAYLHILAFTILALSGISLLDYLFWWQPDAAQVVLLPDSALAGLLLGLGLLGCIQQKPRLANPALSLLLGLALYSLAHNLLSGSPEQGQSLISGYQRMRSSLALLFCLLAIGLLSSQWGSKGQRLNAMLGCAALALAGLSLLSSWLPELDAWRLGYNINVSRPANLFAVSMGLVLLCLTLLPTERQHLLVRSTILTGALGTLITCSVWYLLTLQNIESSSRQSELLLAKQQNSITSSLDTRLALIQRTAEHWAVSGNLPTQAQWQQESRNYLRDFADIGVIALLDEHLRPQRLLGRSHAETEQLTALLGQASPRAWLERLPHDSEAHMSEAYDLAAQPRGLMAIRLSLPDHPDWTLVASLDLIRTLQDGLGSEPNDNDVRIYQGEQLLFDKTSHPPGATGTSKMLGPTANNWRLVSYQVAGTASPTSNHLPGIVVLFGLAFSLVIMVSQRLALLAIEHSKHLQQSNRRLERSLRRQADCRSSINGSWTTPWTCSARSTPRAASPESARPPAQCSATRQKSCWGKPTCSSSCPKTANALRPRSTPSWRANPSTAFATALGARMAALSTCSGPQAGRRTTAPCLPWPMTSPAWCTTKPTPRISATSSA